jgi:hypothetical protein
MTCSTSGTDPATAPTTAELSDEPERDGAPARARERSGEPAGGDVKGDDHRTRMCPRAKDFSRALV